ncbi:MAG: glycosyltransferase [Rhizobiales bacterium]|nr:glycosyltransferase [Hyphomicrobiales bacterium]MBN9010319.1 glycosyltransferase [Hyphomicrobiales bacterium]
MDSEIETERPEAPRTPRLTIAAIIPLYNGEAFIGEALDSVLAQTLPPDEIIVVDDGSKDRGPEIVREYAGKHSSIRLLQKPNGGQSSARNLGIRESNSDLIAFLDQDDAWHKRHLSVLLEPFVTPGYDRPGLSYGNLDQVDRDGRTVTLSVLDGVPSPHPKTSRFACLSQDMFILPSASLASREAIVEAGYFDEELSGYEDDDLFSRMFTRGYQLVFINRPVTRWRIYPSSSSFSRRMAKSRMTYFNKLVATYPDEPEIGNYWVRDVIAPRFLGNLVIEFMRFQGLGAAGGINQTLADIGHVKSFLRRRKRRKVSMLLPAASAMTSLGMTGLARSMLRRMLK